MAMHRQVNALIVLVAMCLLVSWTGGCENGGPRHETVTIKGHTFSLEVAADEAATNKGLGGRASIPEDGGMLFIFPEPTIRRFWMLDCLVDIDIIFLSATGHVLSTHEMQAEPLKSPDETQFEYEERLASYSSGMRAQFAIELKAGWLEKLDLAFDDHIELDIDRLKALAE